MKVYKKILDVICRAFEILATIMLALMVLILVYHVIMRYFFNNAPSWSEEVCCLLMIWFCFISMILGTKNKIHISIELFMSKLPKKALFFVELFDKIMILLFGGAMGYYIIPYLSKLSRNKLPATGLPVTLQYWVAVFAGALIVLISFEHIIMQIKESNSYFEEKEESTNG